METFSRRRGIRRWGFYSKGKLAFAGFASLDGSDPVQLHFIENEAHAHTATLPQRIQLEQRIRRVVHNDVEQVLGRDCRVRVRFDSRKLDERELARTLVGDGEGLSLPNG